MKKVILALGAVALITVGSSAAFSAECDTSKLPSQQNWSYQLTTAKKVGTPFYNPGHPQNNNLFVEVTTVTECSAVNRGGNIVADHSYVLETGESERVLICQQINGLTDNGAELGFNDATCQ